MTKDQTDPPEIDPFASPEAPSPKGRKKRAKKAPTRRRRGARLESAALHQVGDTEDDPTGAVLLLDYGTRMFTLPLRLGERPDVTAASLKRLAEEIAATGSR